MTGQTQQVKIFTQMTKLFTLIMNNMKKLITIALLLLSIGVMAQKQHINQTAPKDNLKQAFEKTNENFDELYVSRDSVSTVLADSVTINEVLEAQDYLQLPILTTAQIEALTPATGMFVFNSTTGKLNYYSSGAWRSIAIE